MKLIFIASFKTLTRHLPGKNEKILEHCDWISVEIRSGDSNTYGRWLS